MENFIVSARKYRPATFADVVGQDHITSTLRNAITRGQLAHAYLFCGPRGVGKTTCARIFAKAINCQGKSAEEPGTQGRPAAQPAPETEAGAGLFEACGGCESCRSFDEGRSFNIHELDAASNNSVEDIRNLTDQVRIPPQVGRYSVYIIDEVHMLSAAAFNAFLKTLEEPPAHAIFILATTEKHKIIPTILSRCQIFDFNRIKVSDGVDYMKRIAGAEGVKYDEESLNLIARKADGGMRDALSMFDKAVSFCGPDLSYREVATSLNILDYDTYFDAMDTILDGDYGAALMLFDRVLAKGFSGQTFMAGLGSHLRDLLVAKNPGTVELLDVTGPLLERYKEQAVRPGLDFLFGAIALLTELDARIRTATNQRLLVELALMKLCNLASPAAAEAEKKNFESLAPQVGLPPVRKPAESGEKPLGTQRQHSEQQRQHSEQQQHGPQQHGPKQPDALQSGKVSGADDHHRPEPDAHHTPEPPASPAPSQNVPAPPQNVPAPPQNVPAPPQNSEAGPSAAEPTHTKRTPSYKGITGRPLTQIMNDATGPVTAKSQSEEPVVPADPEATDKIERHRDKFLSVLAAERPRIGVVYESMETAGSTVKVRVASATLRDEVLRHRTETLQLLAAVAGVRGPLDLEVTVDETMKAARPIRIDDKLRHLSELNPAFNDLRRTLDLEVE